MKHPLVSVIIPSYNHELFVGEAIESVLSQDFSDFELLIADDCSTDNSVNVIKQYTDERIRTFFLTENLGATEILRFLIEHSRGKYIALLNSDDRWRSSKLKKQVEILENNEEYAACFTWADFIDKAGKIIKNDTELDLSMFLQKNRSQAEWINYFFFNGNCLCHPSMLIRKSVYGKIGYYNGALRQLPDFDYWIRLCSDSPIHVIEEVLVDHRRLDGDNTSAISTPNYTRMQSEIAYIYTALFKTIDDRFFRDAFHRNFINPKANTFAELICEKYFLLFNRPVFGDILRNLACQFFMDYYTDATVSKCFKEEYQYTEKDFFNDNCGRGKLDKEENLQLTSSMRYSDEHYRFPLDRLVKNELVFLEDKFRVTFTIPEQTKIIRFALAEGYGLVIKKLNVKVNHKLRKAYAVNNFSIKRKSYFLTKSPQYVMCGKFYAGDVIEIEGVIDSLLDYSVYKPENGKMLNDKVYENSTPLLCNNLLFKVLYALKKVLRKVHTNKIRK